MITENNKKTNTKINNVLLKENFKCNKDLDLALSMDNCEISPSLLETMNSNCDKDSNVSKATALYYKYVAEVLGQSEESDEAETDRAAETRVLSHWPTSSEKPKHQIRLGETTKNFKYNFNTEESESQIKASYKILPKFYPPAARPLKLNRLDMVIAYAKSSLCLSCDSTKHKITNCPYGEFVCPNCHRSSHRGENCPLICRFCFSSHRGSSINDCIKRHVRPPLESLLAMKMPLHVCDPFTVQDDEFSLRPDTMNGRCVYISNMPQGTNEHELQQLICNALKTDQCIKSIEFHKRENSPMYAFVEMSTLQNAYHLVQLPKGSMKINNACLKVQFKKIGFSYNGIDAHNVKHDAQSALTDQQVFSPSTQTVFDLCQLAAQKLSQQYGLNHPKNNLHDANKHKFHKRDSQK